MIRVAVIGYGYWGPNLVRNFAEIDGVEIKTICDRNPERLTLARKRYPAIQTVNESLAVISDSSIDAVVIATPVATHAELALRAIQAGKHVLVEKPLTANSADAHRLVEEARKRDLVLLVDHTFCYTGAVEKMRDLVRSGELGDVYYYDSVRVNLGLFQPDVDVLWDLAVHDLAILDFVFGLEPTSVSCTGIAHIEGQQLNMAYLTLQYEERFLAHIHVNWLAPVKIRRTLIGGSKKMIVYDDLDAEQKVRVYDKGLTMTSPDTAEGRGVYRMLAYRRTGDMLAPKLKTAEALDVEARHFVDCIKGRAKPLTPGSSGARIVRVLEAAGESLAIGGGRIEI